MERQAINRLIGPIDPSGLAICSRSVAQSSEESSDLPALGHSVCGRRDGLHLGAFDLGPANRAIIIAVG